MKINSFETVCPTIPLKPAYHMITALGQHIDSTYVLLRLTTDNGLDSLMTGNIGAGQSVEENLIATASESHPRRNCKIEVSVSSNGAMNSGGSEIADDDTTVTVEPPLVADEENNDPEDTNNPVEIVSSSLPAPGIATLICALAIASLAAPKRF